MNEPGWTFPNWTNTLPFFAWSTKKAGNFNEMTIPLNNHFSETSSMMFFLLFSKHLPPKNLVILHSLLASSIAAVFHFPRFFWRPFYQSASGCTKKCQLSKLHTKATTTQVYTIKIHQSSSTNYRPKVKRGSSMFLQCFLCLWMLEAGQMLADSGQQLFQLHLFRSEDLNEKKLRGKCVQNPMTWKKLGASKHGL